MRIGENKILSITFKVIDKTFFLSTSFSFFCSQRFHFCIFSMLAELQDFHTIRLRFENVH